MCVCREAPILVITNLASTQDARQPGNDGVPWDEDPPRADAPVVQLAPEPDQPEQDLEPERPNWAFLAIEDGMVRAREGV